MIEPIGLFISHASTEGKLADAWKHVIEFISSGLIHVWFSSDQISSGGMTVGKRWIDDIDQYISNSEFVLAIQTPTSANRPWIMWECGAASILPKKPGIIPIIYNIKSDDLNNPLTIYSIYQGDDEASVRNVCERLMRKIGIKPQEILYEAGIKSYFAKIKIYLEERGDTHLERQNVIHGEEATLWQNRIETLVKSGRSNELKSLRQSMYATWGKKPLNLLIHEALGQLLLQMTDFSEALEELNHALEFKPKDMLLLLTKALTLAEQKNFEEASEITQKIIRLDASMDTHPEVAGLQGRIYRELWYENPDRENLLDSAIKSYYKAYENDRTSYYTGINAASLAFVKGDNEFGYKVAQEVLDFCLRLQRQEPTSFWVHFTAGEAYLALGKSDEALVEYKKGFTCRLAPSKREKESALKGAIRMQNAKKLSNSIIDAIVEEIDKLE